MKSPLFILCKAGNFGLYLLSFVVIKHFLLSWLLTMDTVLIWKYKTTTFSDTYAYFILISGIKNSKGESIILKRASSQTVSFSCLRNFKMQHIRQVYVPFIKHFRNNKPTRYIKKKRSYNILLKSGSKHHKTNINYGITNRCTYSIFCHCY
jgi:hypothetical protein